jgi:ATP-dependent Clp protease, protease subunit
MSKRLNRDDIDKWHDSGIYIPTRHIYIGSEQSDDDMNESGCDYLMAERAVKNLHVLESLSKEPITILMNNVGGDEYHGFAIYDAIRLCESHVTIKVLGHAMSMGSIILQAADERLMSETSRQMIHYGTWGIHDHAKTTQKWAKEGEKIDKWMEQMYLAKMKEKNPHFTLARLQRMLDHDTFLTAKESVECGLADKVLGEE